MSQQTTALSPSAGMLREHLSEESQKLIEAALAFSTGIDSLAPLSGLTPADHAQHMLAQVRGLQDALKTSTKIIAVSAMVNGGASARKVAAKAGISQNTTALWKRDAA